MSEEQPNNQAPSVLKRAHVMPYTEEQRRDIVEVLFDYMAEGNSLESGCKQVGVSLATVLRWMKENVEWENRYESAKILRSRALIERSLCVVDQEHDSFTAKIAETKARMFIKVASLINPGEFSERAQAAIHRATGKGQAVSFVLNFGGDKHTPPEQISVTVQPKDGE